MRPVLLHNRSAKAVAVVAQVLLLVQVAEPIRGINAGISHGIQAALAALDALWLVWTLRAGIRLDQHAIRVRSFGRDVSRGRT